MTEGKRNPHGICGLNVPIQGKVSHRFTRMNTDQKENEDQKENKDLTAKESAGEC